MWKACRWLVSLAVLWELFSAFGTSLHAQERSLFAPDPEGKVLERAVRRTRTCAARVENTDKIDTEEVAFAEKLAIPLIFREGRFRLEWKADSDIEQGHETALAFSPLPEGEQLAPREGESENVNKVLNHLSGFIHLDTQTGNITKIHGDLADNVWVDWHHAPANMTLLSFQYDQAERLDPADAARPSQVLGRRHLAHEQEAGSPLRLRVLAP